MFPVITEYFFMDSCLKICAVKEIIKADYCKLLSHKAFMGITKSNRKRTFFQFQVTDTTGLHLFHWLLILYDKHPFLFALIRFENRYYLLALST